MYEKNDLKILAVDDNRDYLRLLKAAIVRALPGGAVFTAADGQEGMRLALAEDPDVILLDIVMPGMSGFELCRQLKADARLKGIPVVFMTAVSAGKETRVEALDAGGEGFLLKPFETEELAAQIRAMAKIKTAVSARSREKAGLKKLVVERTRALEKELAEHRWAEAALREAFQVQSALNAMLRRSLANNSLREKLESHLAALFALRWLGLEPRGAVFLINSGSGAPVLAAHQGPAPAWPDACAGVPPGLRLCAEVAGPERAAQTAAGPARRVFCGGAAPRSRYCAAVSACGKTLGVLSLCLKEGASLTESRRRFIMSVTDIMAENILHARTEEQLFHSQKMESVGRLAGGVAHDFNNILTAVKCYAEFIRRDLDRQDPRAEDVRELMAAADRAAVLTRQLLAFSRRQIMAPRATDINRCVADVANMLRRLIGEDITLVIKPAPGPCTAMLDAGQMEQVLINLAVNARDAMPEGGAIELSTELLAPSPELFQAHPDLPRVPMVRLQVSDTGCGMSDEVKRHLFEPFFTTKEQGKGTGLGLATVFGIVKQSGGDIEVESGPDRGAAFRIYFPYCEPAVQAADADKGARAGAGAGGRETVLLVEDEESLLRLGGRVLSAGGYTVLSAAGGPGAMKEMERRGGPVDILVTDMVMPGMSGRELARELERRGLVGRVLYMSGYTDDAVVKHSVLDPGLAFMYKPFTIDAMLAKVRSVLDSPAAQAKA